MNINYEKEFTFYADEDVIKHIIKCVFEEDFKINGRKYVANKVKISPAIHFYFPTEDDDEKNVYKFKDYQGAFILSNVKKSIIQNDGKIINIEMSEKNEYYENEKMNFNNISSIIYKERMTIGFEKNDFRISFDRIVGVDPYNMRASSLPYYYFEIEFENTKSTFEEIVKKFNLNAIQEPKYVIGEFDESVNLNEIIHSQGISSYLNTLNDNLLSGYFDKFYTKYKFDGENVELELKIKNYTNDIKDTLINELKKVFTVIYEDHNLIEDEYFDVENILLINNLSYRIRKTHNNQRRNLFYKVPQTDKGLFSSRIEYMTKFHNYCNDEIINSGCRANNLLNKQFNRKLSSKLEKIADIKTNRDVFLVLNKEDPSFLVGMLSFDESECICDKYNNHSEFFKEIEFEIYNDCISQKNFKEIIASLNNIFGKYSIDNTNKYLNAMRKLALGNIK